MAQKIFLTGLQDEQNMGSTRFQCMESCKSCYPVRENVSEQLLPDFQFQISSFKFHLSLS
jgi:hypothetical protein